MCLTQKLKSTAKPPLICVFSRTHNALDTISPFGVAATLLNALAPDWAVEREIDPLGDSNYHGASDRNGQHLYLRGQWVCLRWDHQGRDLAKQARLPTCQSAVARSSQRRLPPYLEPPSHGYRARISILLGFPRRWLP